MSDIIKFGALWRQEKSDGTVYYSGRLNRDTKILVFKNKYKKEERHPDLNIFLAPATDGGKEERPDSRNNSQPSGDDIPF